MTGEPDTPAAPPGGLETNDRSKWPGVVALGFADTPNNAGHDNGVAGRTISETKPSASSRVTKELGSRCTTVAVIGLPASGNRTACVMGLSGNSGRYRTGSATGRVGLQRSAAGSGG